MTFEEVSAYPVGEWWFLVDDKVESWFHHCTAGSWWSIARGAGSGLSPPVSCPACVDRVVDHLDRALSAILLIAKAEPYAMCAGHGLFKCATCRRATFD